MPESAISSFTSLPDSDFGDDGPRRVRLPDASLQAREQQWIDFECCQVGPGRYSGRLSHTTVSDAQVFFEAQNRPVHKFGQIPAGSCTVSVVSQAGRSGWFVDRSLDESCLIYLLPAGAQFDLYLPAHTQTLYVALDFEAVMSELRAIDPGRWARRPTELQAIRSPARSDFIRTLSRLMARGRRECSGDALSRLKRQELRQAVMGALSGQSAPEAIRTTHRRRAGIVRLAREFMHASVLDEQSATIVDLVRALDVSERTLQYSFRDLLDTTPVAYWRTLKLSAARKRLIDTARSTTSVTEVATRCGFLHLGRFAKDYRRQFGESPSETLRDPGK